MLNKDLIDYCLDCVYEQIVDAKTLCEAIWIATKELEQPEQDESYEYRDLLFVVKRIRKIRKESI